MLDGYNELRKEDAMRSNASFRHSSKPSKASSGLRQEQDHFNKSALIDIEPEVDRQEAIMGYQMTHLLYTLPYLEESNVNKKDSYLSFFS